MPSRSIPKRPRSTTLLLILVWIIFYASFTLFTPALLDDADSVHAEVAREMLLRHDYVTLYANGIRYLEKAPLLYWAMAFCMRIAQIFGHPGPRALAAAARVPLALTALALAFAVEGFARRAFHGARAGLYAALVLLSCPGIFIFTRITLPDGMVCLWLTLAILCFWTIEQKAALPPLHPVFGDTFDYRWDEDDPRLLCYAFAASCALNVLTKGFIGVVFPIAIVAIYLLLTRGLRGALTRINELHPIGSALVFLAIAVPWHLLAAGANPTRGYPGGLTFHLHPPAGQPHWSVPLPTQGNVHGWAWFYFINEQVLRYLNVRVPRDYDTVPLWLFWGLCLIWLMPWSAFLFKALGPVAHLLRSIVHDLRAANRGPQPASGSPVNLFTGVGALPVGVSSTSHLREIIRYLRWHPTSRAFLLLVLWAVLPILFFSFSTRQEYYVLPALPALALLIAGWLTLDARVAWIPLTPSGRLIRRANLRCTAVLAVLGGVFALASVVILIRAHKPGPSTDPATLLQQNPSDYALSMGHFLDVNAQALGLFRVPLAIAALSLLFGPLASYFLRGGCFPRIRVPHPSSAWVGLPPQTSGADQTRPGKVRTGHPHATPNPHAATLALAAGAFAFLLAVHLALRIFAPVLSSARLAEAIAPQVHTDDLIVIHQEYEYGSTLGFYLQRPDYWVPRPAIPMSGPEPIIICINPIHILTTPNYKGTRNYGRSSNLWYGSFFPDAPALFETTRSLAFRWRAPQRIFVWQDLANHPAPLPPELTPVYVIAKSGGKEIVSNQPNPGTTPPARAYPVAAPTPEVQHAPEAVPAPAPAANRPARRHSRPRAGHRRRTRHAYGR